MNSNPSLPPLSHENWDAGTLACGELVMKLMIRLKTLPSGQILRLTALDPGASADIPAWCRMTGHVLAYHDPDQHHFFIQRK